MGRDVWRVGAGTQRIKHTDSSISYLSPCLSAFTGKRPGSRQFNFINIPASSGCAHYYLAKRHRAVWWPTSRNKFVHLKHIFLELSARLFFQHASTRPEEFRGMDTEHRRGDLGRLLSIKYSCARSGASLKWVLFAASSVILTRKVKNAVEMNEQKIKS